MAAASLVLQGCGEGPWSQIVVGYNFACALDREGIVTCWGADRAPPTEPMTKISSEYANVCGVRSDGGATCWMARDGAGDFGQLAVPADLRFSDVSAGDAHSCGITTGNAALCWGAENFTYDDGQVSETPSGQFKAISAAVVVTCALDLDGVATCWGSDSAQSHPPMDRFATISASTNTTCGLTIDGRAECWGGAALEPEFSQEADWQPDGEFLVIDAGWDPCAIRADGSLVCAEEEELFYACAPPEGVYTSVSAGSYQGCALDESGGATCWTYSYDSQSCVYGSPSHVFG